MIRELLITDLESINEIGSLIKEDFNNKNNIKEAINSDYRKVFVYIENEIIKGFIEIEYHFEIVDVVNIAVKEEFQNKGIASMLINHIVINKDFEKIMLEVRESNTKAINFYKKCGFNQISRRKKYYGNEDAIIMERSI